MMGKMMGNSITSEILHGRYIVHYYQDNFHHQISATIDTPHA